MVANSGASVNSGTLGLPAFLSLPPLPAILAEWLALVPLICHLTNHEEDHQMVGELALTGHLTTGLFPKLGYLDGIWRFLDRGPDFLDRANTTREYAFKVWDAAWGSTSTLANGTASSVITKFALSNNREVLEAPSDASQIMTSGKPAKGSAPPSPPPLSSSSCPTLGVQPSISRQGTSFSASPSSPFRRHQTLHVIRLYRKAQGCSSHARVFYALFHFGVQITYALSLLGTITLLVLLGAYGTAIVMLISLSSKAVCLAFRISRPAGYLDSNERHEACMLSASHDNASTWYLYVGDRGVVDWLLNKHMLSVPSGKSTSVNLFAAFFRFAHLMQLLAMTYVAAQKGIDGVSLVLLMLGNHVVKLLGGKHRLAKQWLDREDVGVDARTFKFSGRTPMVGCVHTLSGAKDAKWMDALISPSKRRDAWTHELGEKEEKGIQDWQGSGLNPSDCYWVYLNTRLTKNAVEIFKRYFPTENRL
ncbi:MAG: hypothetical protein Q9164_003733 [Protoblastenia rupestris]